MKLIDSGKKTGELLNDDVVYFTEDMSQPVYEMNGMYVVEGE